MKTPQQSRSRSTVQAILQATQECLIKSGPAGVTTTKVAARAGCSVGTLYQYFSDREELIAGLVESIGEQEDALVEGAVAGSSGLEETIGNIVRAYFAAVAANQRLFVPLTEALYTICRREEIHRLELRGVARFKKILIRAGYRRRDPERTAFLLSYSYIGMLRFCALVRPRYLKDPAFVEQVVEMLVSHVR